MGFFENLRFKDFFIASALYLSSILLFIFFRNFVYDNYYLQIILPQVLAFTPFFLFAIMNQVITQKCFLLEKISPASLMWVLLLVVVFILPLQIMTTAVNSLFTNFAKDSIAFAKDMKYIVLYNGLWGSIFLFAVMPALFEEVVFRGFLLGLIRRSGMGNAASVIIVALMFSLFHLFYLSYFFAFISGLIIGYLVVMMRSIYGAIFYHLLNNVIVVFFIFYGSQENKSNLDLIKENMGWVLPLSVALLMMGLWILRVRIPTKQKKNCL